MQIINIKDGVETKLVDGRRLLVADASGKWEEYVPVCPHCATPLEELHDEIPDVEYKPTGHYICMVCYKEHHPKTLLRLLYDAGPAKPRIILEEVEQ